MTAPVHAIALCCDAAFLPYAAFLADQIANEHPDRDFDILIASANPLVLPGALKDKGVRFLPLDPGPALEGLRIRHLPPSTYLRLWLADALADRYARVLYLDADMFLGGGDLGALLRADMKGRPLAAVRDMQQWLRPAKHIRDFRIAGLPAAPYFNGGLELFDTRFFRREDLLDRCLTFAAAKPEALTHHDQSLLNCVLHGNWTELSPLWNWQWAGKRPIWGLTEPIRLAHHAGVTKPWSDPRGLCPPRYLMAMAPFLARHFPDAPRGPISPPALRGGGFLSAAAEHVLIAPRIRRYVDRFETPLHTIA